MLAAATSVPASSTLAIVATLGSAALLSFSGRVCMRGRRLRSRGSDDWLLAAAVLCVVGDVVLTVLVLGVGRSVAVLVWVAGLVQILGVGFVKLSVAVTVLKLVVRGWHRHVVVGFVCLTTTLTVLWFGSALLFGGPITTSWSTTQALDDVRRLLDFINSTLDVFTAVQTALLPLLCTRRPSLCMLVVYTPATAAIASASLRTYLLHAILRTSHPTALPTLCTSIELATATLAASLLTLAPLLASRHQHSIKHGPQDPPHPYPSQVSVSVSVSASTSTVIRHPAPSLLTLRFHDAESNLDFDMSSLPPTRTQTLDSTSLLQVQMQMQTQTQTPDPLSLSLLQTHSRTGSGWSRFSGGGVSARRSLAGSFAGNFAEGGSGGVVDGVVGVGVEVEEVGERERERERERESIGIAISNAGEADWAEMAAVARAFGDRGAGGRS